MQTNKYIQTKKCKQASKQIKTKIIKPKQNKEKRTNKRKYTDKCKQTNSDRHKHSKQKGKIKTNNNNNKKQQNHQQQKHYIVVTATTTATENKTVTITKRNNSDHKQAVTRVLRSKNYKYFQRKTPLGCADKPIKLKGGFGGFKLKLLK